MRSEADSNLDSSAYQLGQTGSLEVAWSTFLSAVSASVCSLCQRHACSCKGCAWFTVTLQEDNVCVEDFQRFAAVAWVDGTAEQIMSL